MSIRASLFIIALCLASMAIFVGSGTSRGPSSEIADDDGSDIEQNLKAGNLDPESMNFAFQKIMDVPAEASAPASPTEAASEAPEVSPRIAALHTSMAMDPEHALENLLREKSQIDPNDGGEATDFMALALIIPGQEKEVAEFALAELLANGDPEKSPPAFADFAYRAKALHVFLSKSEDPSLALDGAIQAIVAQTHEGDQMALLGIVDQYLPNGSALIERELEQHHRSPAGEVAPESGTPQDAAPSSESPVSEPTS